MPSSASAEWPQITERDIESHANRLGNLVLLQADINVELDRHDFATKKQAYKNSSYLLTSQVAEEDNWGIQEIEERQKALAKYAIKAWKIA